MENLMFSKKACFLWPLDISDLLVLFKTLEHLETNIPGKLLTTENLDLLFNLAFSRKNN